MSEALQILTELESLGVRVRPAGLKFRYKPESKVPPELLGRMRANRDAIYQAVATRKKSPKSTPTDQGPGTELRAILYGLGVKTMPKGCTCNALMHEMNTLGIEGCRREFDRLLTAFQANSNKFGWGTWIKAAALAGFTGVARKVKWSDPFPDLMRLAIEAAEAKAA